MKNKSDSSLLTLILIILSSLGLLFSLTGIGAAWLILPRIKNTTNDLTLILDETLENTADGLEIMDHVLDDAVENLRIIDGMLVNLEKTVSSTSASLDTSATLIGDDLRLTVLDTQIALSSASTSAEAIDNTLTFLAKVPLLGFKYQPEVPLHISLEQAASSLESFPENLETIEQNLSETAKGLDTLNLNLIDLTANVQNFETNLGDTAKVLKNYTRIVDLMQEKTKNFQSRSSSYLTLLTLFISGILFWLGVSQLNILINLMRESQSEKKVVNLADINRE